MSSHTIQISNTNSREINEAAASVSNEFFDPSIFSDPQPAENGAWNWNAWNAW